MAEVVAGAKPQLRAADNMALAYRWRVDESSLGGFFSKIDGIVTGLAARRDDGFVGAHLYQPVVGPDSAIWELWIGIGPKLFHELITASESALWELSCLDTEMNRAPERTIVKLIETRAPIYRAWAWPPPAAKDPDTSDEGSDTNAEPHKMVISLAKSQSGGCSPDG